MKDRINIYQITCLEGPESTPCAANIQPKGQEKLLGSLVLLDV